MWVCLQVLSGYEGTKWIMWYRGNLFHPKIGLWIIICRFKSKQCWLINDIMSIIKGTKLINFICIFLATGDSYLTLTSCLKVEVSKVHKITHEACDILWDDNNSKWLHYNKRQLMGRKEIDELWNLPSCIEPERHSVKWTRQNAFFRIIFRISGFLPPAYPSLRGDNVFTVFVHPHLGGTQSQVLSQVSVSRPFLGRYSSPGQGGTPVLVGVP